MDVLLCLRGNIHALLSDARFCNLTAACKGDLVRFFINGAFRMSEPTSWNFWNRIS